MDPRLNDPYQKKAYIKLCNKVGTIKMNRVST